MPVSRRLAELRLPAVATHLDGGSVLVQPIGAVEQHGPHLPLATDLVIADTFARAVADEAGERLGLWLLETLAYSKSNEHAWAAGTVWLSATTLLAVLDDIGRSVAATPARTLVFLNGHGGNSALLNVACRELRLAYGLRTFLMHPSLPPDHGGSSPAAQSDRHSAASSDGRSLPVAEGNMSTDELGMGIHGGVDETSLLLHLRPDLVDMSAARRAVPEHLAGFEHVRFGGSVSFGWTSDDFGTDGVIGDPTGATAERGKELFDGMVTTAVSALAEVRRFSPRPPT